MSGYRSPSNRPGDVSASRATAHDRLGVACSTNLPAGLTPAILARLYRETMRDKSYQDSPIGGIVAQYLRHKNRRLAATSQRSYEGSLANLARFFADLTDLHAFDPPLGTAMIEDYLAVHWGHAKDDTYRVNLAITADFFKWAAAMGMVSGNPCLLINRPRRSPAFHEVFTADDRRRILAANHDLRDRIALRLLIDYGLRKGSLQRVQFLDFDHHRRTLRITKKGGRTQLVPIPEPMFWRDLERHILDTQAQPTHYLMASARVIPNVGRIVYPDKPLSPSGGMHRWWYRCLAKAGVVDKGVSRGERMHKARHTAGQRLLDHRGNLKAVQKLLGHESIRTTADTYVDWDIDQLAASLEAMFRQETEEGPQT